MEQNTSGETADRNTDDRHMTEALAEVEALAPSDPSDGKTPGLAAIATIDRSNIVTRDRFLKRAKTARRLVRVPLPWMDDDETKGNHVFVRGMGARQRDKFEDSITVQVGKETVVSTDNVRAKVIVACTVDENGTRLFTDKDEDAIGELDARTADAIYAVAARESGITKADVEALVGNSASGQ